VDVDATRPGPDGPTPSVDDLRAAGLYDPAAPDAHVQLNVLRLISARGGTIEQMVAAAESGRLSRLAVELLFLPRSGRATLAEVADAAGIPAERMRALWRAAGFPDVADDDRRFTPAEVDVVRTFEAGAALFGEAAAMQLLRVVGSAMARIADATVSTFVTTVGAAAMAADPESRALEEANSSAAALVPQLQEVMDALLRQHLVQAARPNITGVAPAGYEVMPLAVGFVDIVGSAALAQHVALDELGAAVAAFERGAADEIVAAGGRVVKFIGDEVMFSVPSARAGCEIADAIVRCFVDDAVLPGVRGGVAHGDVMMRDADCFGPVVNLAARAVKVARPGTVVVSGAARDAADAEGVDLAFTPLPAATLKGFDAPVPLYEIRGVSASGSDR
jgi:class 3 adenylate cyclase